MSTRDLPERIRTRREHLGWRRENLAANLGVSFTTVTRWERGSSTPTGLYLTKVLEWLKEGE